MGAHTVGHVHKKFSGYGFDNEVLDPIVNAWDLSPTVFDNGYYFELVLHKWKLTPLDNTRSIWSQNNYNMNQLIMLNTDIVTSYPIDSIISSNQLGIPGTICGDKALIGEKYGCIFPKEGGTDVYTSSETFSDTNLISTFDQIKYYMNFRVHWLHDFSLSFTKMTTAGFKVIQFEGEDTNIPHMVTVLPERKSEKLGTVYPIDLEKCPST